MSAWAADALWLGPLICTRLRAELPELRDAFVIDALEPGETDPKQDPAAVVLLDALRPASADPLQRQAMTEQDWLVLLAVRSAQRAPDRHRVQLGPLVSKTVRALQGWVPPGHQRGFAWRRGPRPDYGKNISYFPLLFTMQIVTS